MASLLLAKHLHCLPGMLWENHFKLPFKISCLNLCLRLRSRKCSILPENKRQMAIGETNPYSDCCFLKEYIFCLFLFPATHEAFQGRNQKFLLRQEVWATFSALYRFVLGHHLVPNHNNSNPRRVNLDAEGFQMKELFFCRKLSSLKKKRNMFLDIAIRELKAT